MTQNQAEKTQNFKVQDEEKIEQQFLEGTKVPDLGVYSEIFSAKSSFAGQDGGVVSALLVKGFEEGIFDGAVVVRRGEGYSAEAVSAFDAGGVLAASGTKYLSETKESAVAEVQDAAKRAGYPDAKVIVLKYEEAAYTGKVYPTEKYYPTWVLEK